jgi:rubrerythrin
MDRKFQRKKENFVCESCGAEVTGDGYTNHCPICLCSKHVDINPGDRASDCKGLMEPIALENKDGEQVIVHRCVVCGYKKKNKTSKEDSFEELLNITF